MTRELFEADNAQRIINEEAYLECYNEEENKFYQTLADNAAKRAYLYTSLCHSIMTFDYTKADGTSRKLVGTLIRVALPEELQTISQEPAVVADGSKPIVLYDLEKKGWRSISVDRVNSFTLSFDLPE
jgi:hypothetical protein